MLNTQYLPPVTTTYNSVLRTAHYISDVLPHPKLVTIPIGFPTTHAEIIQNFKEYLDANPANPNKRRVAVIDSIVSNPGCLLPWKEMTKIAKDANVWSVVDAAHSIGQEVGLNLTEAAPDFWISVRVYLSLHAALANSLARIELSQVAQCKALLCSALCAIPEPAHYQDLNSHRFGIYLAQRPKWTPKFCRTI